MRTRIRLLLLACLLPVGCSSLGLSSRFAELERASGGRLGLFAFNTATGEQAGYRANERFALCSTFKAILVAAVLYRAGKSDALLAKRLAVSAAATAQAGYSPITSQRVGRSMTVAELSAATLQYSDNAAANLLLNELGGPSAVTDFARLLGDEIFRLDRIEPYLNSAEPGDERDTTTPAAMGETLHKLLISNGLPALQHDRFENWLKGNTTGDKRLRAGVPVGWNVGDKTGTGSYGTTNDIGILYPPEGAPWIVAVYFTQNDKQAPARDDVVASATRLLGLQR
jgi:beta-lactamase class A